MLFPPLEVEGSNTNTQQPDTYQQQLHHHNHHQNPYQQLTSHPEQDDLMMNQFFKPGDFSFDMLLSSGLNMMPMPMGFMFANDHLPLPVPTHPDPGRSLQPYPCESQTSKYAREDAVLELPHRDQEPLCRDGLVKQEDQDPEGQGVEDGVEDNSGVHTHQTNQNAGEQTLANTDDLPNGNQTAHLFNYFQL